MYACSDDAPRSEAEQQMMRRIFPTARRGLWEDAAPTVSRRRPKEFSEPSRRSYGSSSKSFDPATWRNRLQRVWPWIRRLWAAHESLISRGRRWRCGSGSPAGAIHPRPVGYDAAGGMLRQRIPTIQAVPMRELERLASVERGGDAPAAISTPYLGGSALRKESFLNASEAFVAGDCGVSVRRLRRSPASPR